MKGQRYGDYTLDRMLGQGGLAEAWKAFGPDQEPVVVKIIVEPNAHWPLQEVEPPTSIEHLNVARVLDADFHARPPYLVRQFLDGSSLAELLDTHDYFPHWLVTPIFLQLVRGLEALHRHGVVHANLKPENVLLGSDGTLKVADPRLSKEIQELTRGVMAGEVQSSRREHYHPLEPWLAPEVQSGREHTRASDTYSLGLLLYRMCTGNMPEGFNAPYPSQMDRRNLKIFDQMVMATLARRASDRARSLAALESDFLKGLERAGVRCRYAQEPFDWVQPSEDHKAPPVGAPRRTFLRGR